MGIGRVRDLFKVKRDETGTFCLNIYIKRSNGRFCTNIGTLHKAQGIMENKKRRINLQLETRNQRGRSNIGAETNSRYWRSADRIT